MSLVNSFTVANRNTFPVDVVLPNTTTQTIGSQAGKTFSSYGTYTIKQSGSTGVYFSISYPSTRILSTATASGNLTGDFQISATLQ